MSKQSSLAINAHHLWNDAGEQLRKPATEWVTPKSAENLLLLNNLHLIYNGYRVRLAHLSNSIYAQADLSTFTQETFLQL